MPRATPTVSAAHLGNVGHDDRHDGDEEEPQREHAGTGPQLDAAAVAEEEHEHAHGRDDEGDLDPLHQR